MRAEAAVPQLLPAPGCRRLGKTPGTAAPAQQQSSRDARMLGTKDTAKALLKQGASSLLLAGFGLASSLRCNPLGCLRNLLASF